MSNLRKKLIRLAYAKPHLRRDILPLIQENDRVRRASCGGNCGCGGSCGGNCGGNCSCGGGSSRVGGCGCSGGGGDAGDVEINVYGEELEAARKFDPLDKRDNPNYGPPYKNDAGKWEPENKGKCYYQTRNEEDRCYVTSKGGPKGKTKGKNTQKAGPPKSDQRRKYNKEYKKMRWPKGNR